MDALLEVPLMAPLLGMGISLFFAALLTLGSYLLLFGLWEDFRNTASSSSSDSVTPIVLATGPALAQITSAGELLTLTVQQAQEALTKLLGIDYLRLAVAVVLAAIALLWIGAHDTVLEEAFTFAQCYAQPVWQVIGQIINTLRVLGAIAWIFVNGFVTVNWALGWSFARKIIFECLLVDPVATFEPVLLILSDALQDLAAAFDTFFDGDPAADRIYLVPFFATIGLLGTNVADVLNCTCNWLGFLFYELATIPQSANLHAALDCAVNTAVRALQVVLVALVNFQIPVFEPMFVELSCVVLEAGDFAEDVVFVVISFVNDTLSLVSVGAQQTPIASDLVGARIAAAAAYQASLNTTAASVRTIDPLAATILALRLPINEPKEWVARSSVVLNAMDAGATYSEAAEAVALWEEQQRTHNTTLLYAMNLSIAEEAAGSVLSAAHVEASLELPEVLGFQTLIRIGEAPWSRSITEIAVAGISFVNGTLALLRLASEATLSMQDRRFFQTGYILDHVRAAGKSLGAVAAALYEKLNGPLDLILVLIADAIQVVLETVIEFIFYVAYGMDLNPGDDNPFASLIPYCMSLNETGGKLEGVNRTTPRFFYKDAYNHSAEIAELFGCERLPNPDCATISDPLGIADSTCNPPLWSKAATCNGFASILFFLLLLPPL